MKSNREGSSDSDQTPIGEGQSNLSTVKANMFVSSKNVEDTSVLIAETLSVITAAPTEHTASLSSSPRSRSSSLASDTKAPELLDICFVCSIRAQENDELEQRLKLFRDMQKELEDEIILLTEDAETNAAQFETLAALYHADKMDLEERLRVLEGDNSILESSFVDLEEKNTRLKAQLQQAGAIVEQNAMGIVNAKDEKETASKVDHLAHIDELQESLKKSQRENEILQRSLNTLLMEKAAITLRQSEPKPKNHRVARQRLKDEMFRSKDTNVMNAFGNEMLSTISCSDMNDLQQQVQFLEDKNLLLGRSFTDLKTEKAILQEKLQNAEMRIGYLEAKQLEMEDVVLCLQESAVASVTEFDSISVLSVEERNDLEEKSRLLEEDNSILQRSFEYLRNENQIFEAKLQEAEARTTQNLAHLQQSCMDESNLLQDRITELVKEKAAVLCRYDNAVNEAAKKISQKEAQIQKLKIHLQGESKKCTQVQEDLTLALAQVDLLSELASTRLIEKEEVNAEVVVLEQKMRAQADAYERSFNAYEAELELRMFVNADMEAKNALMAETIGNLPSISSNQTNRNELEKWIQELQEETHWYKVVASQYQTELESLLARNTWDDVMG
jgi:chromosome segregation ATPase